MLGLIKNMFGGSNNEELKNIIKNGALLIDVRTPSEFADGSVKGAITYQLIVLKNKLIK